MQKRVGEAKAEINKLVALVVHKPSMTQDEFLHYWRYRHGPLVATTPDYGQFRTRYVQSHFTGPGPLGGSIPFEGLAGVWLPESPPADFGQTSAYLERIRPDEETFLDLERSIGIAVHEAVVVDGRGPAKAIVIAARDPALDRREFHEAMLGTYKSSITGSPDVGDGIRGMSINLVRGMAHMSGRKPEVPVNIDCILEFWFDSDEDLHRALGSASHLRLLHGTDRPLIDATTVVSVYAREFVFYENSNPTPLAITLAEISE